MDSKFSSLNTICYYCFVCAGVHECPFLYARIFTSIAKFTSVVTIQYSLTFRSCLLENSSKISDFVQISHGVLEQLLNAAIRAIGMDV